MRPRLQSWEFVGVFPFLSLLSLSFGVSFLGVFSLAGSGRSFSPFGFRRALYVVWVCFAWFYFLLEPFFRLGSESATCVLTNLAT
jgi:hypothetical protein